MTDNNSHIPEGTNEDLKFEICRALEKDHDELQQKLVEMGANDRYGSFKHRSWLPLQTISHTTEPSHCDRVQQTAGTRITSSGYACSPTVIHL